MLCGMVSCLQLQLLKLLLGHGIAINRRGVYCTRPLTNAAYNCQLQQTCEEKGVSLNLLCPTTSKLSISSEYFSEVQLDQRIDKLCLVNSRIRTVHDGAFDTKLLAKLSVLVLELPRLTALSNNTFQGLRHLSELAICDAVSLHHVDSGVLNPVRFSLKRLSISGLQQCRKCNLLKNFTGAVELVSMEILDIRYNNLKDLQSGTFKGASSVRSMYLSHSNVQDVEPGAFSHLGSLEQLFLNGNFLKSLEEGVFRGMPYVRSVWLDNNPWNCTCSLQWMQTWLGKGLASSSMPRCMYPEKISGRNLAEVTLCEAATLSPEPVGALLPGGINQDTTIKFLTPGNPSESTIGLSVSSTKYGYPTTTPENPFNTTQLGDYKPYFNQSTTLHSEKPNISTVTKIASTQFLPISIFTGRRTALNINVNCNDTEKCFSKTTNITTKVSSSVSTTAMSEKITTDDTITKTTSDSSESSTASSSKQKPTTSSTINTLSAYINSSTVSTISPSPLTNISPPLTTYGSLFVTANSTIKVSETPNLSNTENSSMYNKTTNEAASQYMPTEIVTKSTESTKTEPDLNYVSSTETTPSKLITTETVQTEKTKKTATSLTLAVINTSHVSSAVSKPSSYETPMTTQSTFHNTIGETSKETTITHSQTGHPISSTRYVTQSTSGKNTRVSPTKTHNITNPNSHQPTGTSSIGNNVTSAELVETTIPPVVHSTYHSFVARCEVYNCVRDSQVNRSSSLNASETLFTVMFIGDRLVKFPSNAHNFFIINEASDNGQKIKITMRVPESSTLVWVRTKSFPSGLGCLTELSSVVTITDLLPDKSYMFCVLVGLDATFSPFNCLPHVTSSMYEDQAWITNREKAVVLFGLASCLTLAVLLGAALLFLFVKRYPTLIKGKRVLVAKHRVADVIILPSDYKGELLSAEVLQEQVASDGTLRSKCSRASTSSYVTVNEPTALELFAYRFEQMAGRLRASFRSHAHPRMGEL